MHLPILAVLSAAAITSAASAGNPVPTPSAIEAHNQRVEQRYMDMQAWCDAPVPTPARGEAVIYYARNEFGQCVPHLIVGGR